MTNPIKVFGGPIQETVLVDADAKRLFESFSDLQVAIMLSRLRLARGVIPDAERDDLIRQLEAEDRPEMLDGELLSKEALAEAADLLRQMYGERDFRKADLDGSRH